MVTNYEIKDYEISILLSRRNFHRKGTKSTNFGLAYYYTRSIIRYMARLVFAIGWNKLRNNASVDVNKEIYTTLFKNPQKKRGCDSIEPGAFAHLLNNCAERLAMHQDVNEEIKILSMLGNVRNYNAHVINTVDFSTFYKDADEAFSRFANYFQGKQCSYVIPNEYVESNQIQCNKLGIGDRYPEEIILDSNLFKWSRNGNRLFYAVTNGNTCETVYYNLSPFIEIPSFIEDEYPHFRIYDRVKDNGYGNECDQLYYDTVLPQNIRQIDGEYGPELSAEFEKTFSDYKRSELFLSSAPDNRSVWVPSFNSNVFINISSYPGFGDVHQSKYKYCFDICPIRMSVMNFCKENKKQVAQITGNGGVGKTALVLSILSELFMDRSMCNYSNLIFISAKKSYYSFDNMNYNFKDLENEADVHSYNDLIIKIADLLGIVYSDDDINCIAESIVQQVNDGVSCLGPKKRVLLVIDDMDSLIDSDQRLIIDFIYKFDARVFKTIMTTRNIADSSPVSYQINELTDVESLLFAKWYAENILEIPSWNRWSRRQVAEDWVIKCGEGNPLTVQMILTLVKRGLEQLYSVPATQMERMAYLYNTVQNLLATEEKQIFEICRQLYTAIPEDRRSNEMLLIVPEYLAAGCGITQGIFKKSIDKLVRLKLIMRMNNQLQFKLYSSFILADGIVKIDKNLLPAMFSVIWTDVKKNPDDWLTIGTIEEKLVDYIISIEGKEKFDIITARCIFERILTDSHIYIALKDKLISWLEKHSIGNNSRGEETANRLIQSIEKRWSMLKKTIENGNEDPLAESTLNDEIHQLQKIISVAGDEDIFKRLALIRSEIKAIDNL